MVWFTVEQEHAIYYEAMKVIDLIKGSTTCLYGETPEKIKQFSDIVVADALEKSNVKEGGEKERLKQWINYLRDIKFLN